MEVSKWKRRRYTPAWGGNQEEDEPCVVVFAPPSVGWMARWRELALQAPNIDADKLSEEGYLDTLGDWTKGLQCFRDELLEDLVLAVENLTTDGKAISLEDALAFILDNEGLREEIFTEILSEGTVTQSQGKDSE